jgi:hypothetical protein
MFVTNVIQEPSFKAIIRFLPLDRHSPFNSRAHFVRRSRLLLWENLTLQYLQFSHEPISEILAPLQDLMYAAARRPVAGAGCFWAVMTYPLPEKTPTIPWFIWAELVTVSPICPMFWWEKSGMFTFEFCGWCLRLICNINRTRVLSVVLGLARTTIIPLREVGLCTSYEGILQYPAPAVKQSHLLLE